jgi:large subunit ribosomal protein L29
MKAAELRSLSLEELERQSVELRDRLFRLRMQHYTGQLEKPSEISKARVTVARIETILTEKRGR